MTREQIIETMARGIDPYAWDADTIDEPARHSCRAKAERCLSALEAAGLVIVPVVPTPAMQDSLWLAAQLQNANAQYTAMVKAALDPERDSSG
jgi:hypothetical protein